MVNYDEVLKDSIINFYNKYNSNNNENDNNKNQVSDADIYQILISHMNTKTYKPLMNDIKKLKNIKNFEILYYIFIQYGAIREQKTSKFFDDNTNNNNIRNQENFFKLIYEVIDYNNTELIIKF